MAFKAANLVEYVTHEVQAGISIIEMVVHCWNYLAKMADHKSFMHIHTL